MRPLHRCMASIPLYFALAGCAITAASVPLVEQGKGENLAGVMNHSWARQAIGESGVSIEFPTALTVQKVGGETGMSAFYELLGSGAHLYALNVPGQIALKDLQCDNLPDGITALLSVDLKQHHRCSIIDGALIVIGFGQAGEGATIDTQMLLAGTDEVVLLENLLSIEQLSPAADRALKDYYLKHPELTQIWLTEPSGKAIDAQLRKILQGDLQKPSVGIVSAMAFLERVAQSARWEE